MWVATSLGAMFVAAPCGMVRGVAAQEVPGQVAPVQETPEKKGPAREAPSRVIVIDETVPEKTPPSGVPAPDGGNSKPVPAVPPGANSVPAVLDAVHPRFGERPLRVIILSDGQDENGQPRLTMRYVTDDEVAGANHKFWIGVRVEPATATLRSQLKLANDQGVVVLDTMPESPARKAGLKPHDIVLGLAADEAPAGAAEASVSKPVGDTGALVKQVEEAGAAGKELSLVCLSGGGRVVLRVKPETRPTDAAPDAGGEVQGIAVGSQIGDTPRFFQIAPNGVPPAGGIAVFTPGAVVADRLDTTNTNAVKADLSIGIQRKDNQPAQITVKWGDQSWSTSEDRLEVLPEPIRSQVGTILGKGSPAATGSIRFAPATIPRAAIAAESPPGVVRSNVPPAPPKVPAPKSASNALQQAAEALAREELARVRALKRYPPTVEGEPNGSADRLDRIEKSLAELIELQKALVPALQSLAERETKPVTPSTTDKPANR